MELNSDDFYKELRLRGYQYKDAFLGFVEANGEGNFFKLVIEEYKCIEFQCVRF